METSTRIESQRPGEVARGMYPLIATALAAMLGCTSGLAGAEPVNRSYPAPALTGNGTEIGVASWYGPGFHGKRTASGEVFDQFGLTAAHRTLPLGTQVEVTELEQRRSIVVRINDRGPYKADRMLDLSRGAAEHLGIVERGTAPVELRVLGDGADAWPTVHYSVQIGAYDRRVDADRFGEQAAARGEEAYLKTRGPSAPSRYSVRVGPYAERYQAIDAAERLRRGGFDVFVVEEDAATAEEVAAHAQERSAEDGDAAGLSPRADTRPPANGRMPARPRPHR